MANNNLVTVRRADVTGKVVTRHVRASSVAGNTSALPAPTVGGDSASRKAVKKSPEEAALQRRVASMDRTKARIINAKKHRIVTSYEYEKYAASTYKFNCSDNDFYAVLEHFSVGDTIALMGAGLKAEEVRRRVEGGQRFTASGEHSELVAGLRSRTIPMMNFCKMYAEHGYYAEHEVDQFLDVVESYSLDEFKPESLKRTQQQHTNFAGESYSDLISQQVLHRWIRFSDVKTVGPQYCVDNYVEMMDALQAIKSGKSACTAAELRVVVDQPDANLTRSAVRTRLAVRYGAEFAASIQYPNMAMFTEESAKKMSPEEGMAYLSYADRTFTEEPESAWEVDGFSEKGHLEMWKAGVSAESARDGLERGFTSGQIIGIHREGIHSSVADGWL